MQALQKNYGLNIGTFLYKIKPSQIYRPYCGGPALFSVDCLC